VLPGMDGSSESQGLAARRAAEAEAEPGQAPVELHDRSGGEVVPDPPSAEQCPRSVGDEVRALLWHPVAAALDDLEGEVSPMGLDLVEHRHRNVEVISAEQQLRRRREPLPLECVSQQDCLPQAQVDPLEPRAGRSAGAIAELVGIQTGRHTLLHPPQGTKPPGHLAAETRE
jgi:hypothetical protein